MPRGIYKRTKEHKRRIGIALQKPVLGIKYPKLPDELNRAKKLTDSQIIKIVNLHAKGESRYKLAEKFGVSFHTIYRYTNPSVREKQRIYFKERYHTKLKFDPKYKKENTKRSIESKKYRRGINYEEYKAWEADKKRKKYHEKIRKN